jgi:hypothetical protein
MGESLEEGFTRIHVERRRHPLCRFGFVVEFGVLLEHGVSRVTSLINAILVSPAV